MKKRDIPIDRAEPDDEDYRPPNAGGCWFCYRNVDPDGDYTFFDMQMDAYYHGECADDLDIQDPYQWETRHD